MSIRSSISRRTALARMGTLSSAALGLLGGVWASEPLSDLKSASKSEPKSPESALDPLMRDFVEEFEVPGASLAVTQGRRLVYAKGFGLADQENTTPVEANSLFRIASVSKPITAVAILRLVDRGKLTLHDRIVDLLELKDYKDRRWEQITLLNLLQHRAGFDRGVSVDPMFLCTEAAEHFKEPPPAMPGTIIRYMLEQPLDSDPAARYAYSNFGYSLLGRVIEKVSGIGYEEAIRRDILGPLGIRGMRIGMTQTRCDREVRYYVPDEFKGPAVMGQVGEEVSSAYGTWCLEALDSHGGWIASAIDLVRFASNLNGEETPLLSRAAFELLQMRPEGARAVDDEGHRIPNYYGCGWGISLGNQGRVRSMSHAGALPGTSTQLMWRRDGVCWAVLFNSRRGNSESNLSTLVEPRLHAAVDAITEWPEGDLFGEYLQR